MATPIETVKKIMVTESLPYYVVKRPDGGLICKQDTEMTASAAADQLDEMLSGLTYPYVEVTLSKQSSDEKKQGGNRKADLTHRISLKGAHGAHDSAAQNIKDSHINKTIIDLMRELGELRAAMVEKEYAAKLALLERKIEDAQEDKRNPMQEAAIMALINMFGGSTATGTASGQSQVVNGTETVSATASDAERLKSVIYRMKSLRPDYIEVLEKLVSAAEKQPSKIDMLMNFL